MAKKMRNKSRFGEVNRSSAELNRSLAKKMAK
jgi:hypothetical protein